MVIWVQNLNVRACVKQMNGLDIRLLLNKKLLILPWINRDANIYQKMYKIKTKRNLTATLRLKLLNAAKSANKCTPGASHRTIAININRLFLGPRYSQYTQP